MYLLFTWLVIGKKKFSVMRDLIEKFSLMRDLYPRPPFATMKATKGKQETYWNTGSFHQVGGVGGRTNTYTCPPSFATMKLSNGKPQPSYWNTGAAASIKWQV